MKIKSRSGLAQTDKSQIVWFMDGGKRGLGRKISYL
jgi:hypothetical protein